MARRHLPLFGRICGEAVAKRRFFTYNIPPSRVKGNLKTLRVQGGVLSAAFTASNVRLRAETSQSMRGTGGLQSASEVIPDSCFKLWVSIAPVSRTKQEFFQFAS